ncbi:MAG: N-acetyltransferase family protein [Methanomicrobiales archaeon]|nr:N-acetyltransferase family protein [Methanomicrobiales archaeon]
MEDRYLVRPVREDDLLRIREIFNWYVRESFAAYPVNDVEIGFFQMLYREGTSCPLFVVETDGDIAGFGLIRPYLPFPSFRKTAQVSYFICPGYTGRGMGTMLLERLTREARSMEIHTLLANISSRNEPSLKFHARHGFTEVGRLKGIGEKFGKRFDVVWMQKEV